MTSTAEWIAVDWGTSNLRLWGIAANGAIHFTRTSDEGMGKLARQDFPRVLADLLAGTRAAGEVPLEVLICGMAGARQGWVEAPYLEVPTDLDALFSGAVIAPTPGAPYAAKILPGLCQTAPGAEDVMRGEETQLLGLGALLPGFSGPVVMPGTHSKWVVLDGNRVERFTTVMTGELFHILGTHSVLRHALAGPTDGPDHADGLDDGLTAGIEAPQRLTTALFRTRAASLLSGKGPDWAAGYLSGLLIGAEIGGLRDWIGSAEIPLVGSPALCQLYARGLTKLGVQTRIIDATDATLSGLKAARGQNRR